MTPTVIGLLGIAWVGLAIISGFWIGRIIRARDTQVPRAEKRLHLVPDGDDTGRRRGA